MFLFYEPQSNFQHHCASIRHFTCLVSLRSDIGVWCVPGFLSFSYILYQVSDHLTCASMRAGARVHRVP